MELLDQFVHVLQDVVLFFTCVIRGCPSLTLAHAHGAPGGVEPDAYLPAHLQHSRICTVKCCCRHTAALADLCRLIVVAHCSPSMRLC